MNRFFKAAAVITATVGFAMATTTPADAANMWVKNADCKASHMTVLTRDKTGKRYTIPPGATRIMPNGGRQVWVPAQTYMFKGGCSSAWDIDTGSGHWKSFSWTPETKFSIRKR